MFASPNSRLKILIASGLWAILVAQLVALGCATSANTVPPPVGTVVEVIKNFNYHTGGFNYFLKVEYDTDMHVHNTVILHVDQRDFMLFGRVGARVCLYPYERIWRLGKCPD